jgi:hypothetical protein
MARWRENTPRKLPALSRFLRVLAVVLLALGATACKGGSGDAGPTGKPATVVAKAPDITFATLGAHVVGAAPGVTATGRVDFKTGGDALSIRGLKKASPPFGVTQPAAMIDLLRGVVAVRSYGGSEVQGDGTKHYEVDIDLFKAITSTPVGPRRVTLHLLDAQLGPDNKVWADVFIDSAGRVRRVLLPVKTDSDRPYGQSKIIPQMVSVDYSDFGSGK